MQAIEKWRKNFNLPIEEKFTIPDSSSFELAYSLIIEELEELRESYYKYVESPSRDNIPEILDALGDGEFVQHQMNCIFGFRNQLRNEVVQEIAHSNNSKMCSGMKEAKDTREFYNQYNIKVEVIEVERDGRKYYKVVNKDTRKVLKNLHWEEPDFTKIIDDLIH